MSAPRKEVLAEGVEVWLGDCREIVPTLVGDFDVVSDPPYGIAHVKGGGGLGADFDLDGGLLAYGGNDTRGPINVATARNAHGGPAGRLDFESETFVVAPGVAASLTRGAESAGKGGYAGRRQEDDSNLVVRPINTMVGLRHEALGEGTGLGIGGEGDPAYTLSKAHAHAVQHGWAVRRLTPRECERLQGFPDDYTLITHRGKPAADGPRYKALGNSMAVNVMRVLGERIALVDAISAQRAAA